MAPVEPCHAPDSALCTSLVCGSPRPHDELPLYWRAVDQPWGRSATGQSAVTYVLVTSPEAKSILSFGPAIPTP